MSIEDEIRRIVNEELDRRAEEARYQLLKSNTQLYEDALRKMRDAPASNWDFNEVAMPEPEVPWKERHDRTPKDKWSHPCSGRGGLDRLGDVLLPIGVECSDCDSYLAEEGSG